MIKVLIVEDEEKIARFIELELKHEGYEVDKALDGRTGAEKALTHDYDLILLDILLPQLNGLEVLRRIRREKNTPTIMLTARDSVMDKVAGLDAGADDYLTKPFAIEELLARIRVALKHHEVDSTSSQIPSNVPTKNVFTIKGVSLDVDRREVCVNNNSIELTTKEFEVLRMLMKHAGVVLSRERIASEALGYEFAGETNNVDVHIAHLRAKIDDQYNIKLITTVRGVGYVIREI